ncbi:MAG: helix-turn-helix transcriptional regulator [Clostridia bacterium]|nr:helix-turn-helix transcriptional regulator [Clostridia bacterium]
MTTNDAVAFRTINLLKEKKMTQYKLEKNSGIDHGAMDRILSGKNKTITLTTIYKLARGFNITFEEFMNDDIFHSTEMEID